HHMGQPFQSKVARRKAAQNGLSQHAMTDRTLRSKNY
ncbi:MAG: hypothetical protein ACI8QF_002201, partial [Limisphaerales bacterium]